MGTKTSKAKGSVAIMAGDKGACVLRYWQIVLIVVGVIFLILGIMGFVGIRWSNSGVTLALLIVGALVFIICGIFAFITSAKGRQSRPLVICFMITMICFFSGGAHPAGHWWSGPCQLRRHQLSAARFGLRRRLGVLFRAHHYPALYQHHWSGGGL